MAIEPLEARWLLNGLLPTGTQNAGGISPAVTPAATVNAGTVAPNSTGNVTNVLGVNLVYWDDQMTTTQTQQMVQPAGLNVFRFPAGGASDDFHFQRGRQLGR